MFIKKGTKLTVQDNRKGTFQATAAKDFDTETDEFYPILTQEYVCGLANEWYPGEKIPCRKGISRIIVEQED